MDFILLKLFINILNDKIIIFNNSAVLYPYYTQTKHTICTSLFKYGLDCHI